MIRIRATLGGSSRIRNSQSRITHSALPTSYVFVAVQKMRVTATSTGSVVTPNQDIVREEASTTSVSDFELATNVVSESVVFESSDESVAVISGNTARHVSNGTATITARIASGWERSKNLTFTTTNDVSTNATEYTSGSVARAATDYAQGLISGASGGNIQGIFSLQNHGAQTYTRNPDVWANISALPQMAALSPWNSTGGQTRAGVLITPQHTIQAAHYPIPVGTVMRFVDASNNVVERTVVGKRRHPDYANLYPDLEVCSLSAPLPASDFPHVEVLPTNYANYLPTLAGDIYQGIGVPVLALDKEEKALVSHWTRTNAPPYSRHVIGYPYYYDNDAQLALEVALYEQRVGGDSGNPVFLLLDGNMIILTVWTFVSSGTTIADHLPAINHMIADADADAGISTGYTVTEADLSAFTDFS